MKKNTYFCTLNYKYFNNKKEKKMAQVHNFNAGPCVLPKPAIESAIEAIRNFDNTGIGVLEISHRTPGWERIMRETEELWRELLHIPDNYDVLFLGGGASTQFFTVAANLMTKKAAYLQTGVWAKKAAKEAKFYGEVEIVASSEDKNYSYVPKNYNIPADADYFHITTNNTIYGTEIKYDMDCPINLVADMSSDIMSRPVDVAKYALIYGGAQKNVGPAGVTFVIVRRDILGKTGRELQTMVDYRTHIAKEAKDKSMFNTPPVFSIFVMHETLKWVKSLGGVEKMHEINMEKANTLYNEIDRNKMFIGTAVKEDRSIMNICWVMAPGFEDKQDTFMAFAKENGMVGIKGHRSVGGFRASLYNACPLESVQALVACMQEFEKING
jgi:phosphoserine aminotransferase